jgi:hypothetical protein
VRRNTSWAARPTRRNVKRCALCHGKLGLGAHFRNIWNGTWWVHVRFCSARCEAIYQESKTMPPKTVGTPSLLAAFRGVEYFAQIVKTDHAGVRGCVG